MLIAFPLQQWSNERPLNATLFYIAFLCFVSPPPKKKTAPLFMKLKDVQQQYVEVSHIEFHQIRATEMEGTNRSKTWFSLRRFT